jgi:hypothetical protein
VIAATAIAMLSAIVFLVALYPSLFIPLFIQDPWAAIPRATPEEIAKVHEPEALRADLDAIVAMHERTCPNPYLRVSRESIFARGERLLPFRAAPKDDALVVVAVAEAEHGIQPGDAIVRIGSVSAADHLVRLRALVPAETERYRDVNVRERFRTLAWSAGITLPTEVEIARPDGHPERRGARRAPSVPMPAASERRARFPAHRAHRLPRHGPPAQWPVG